MTPGLLLAAALSLPSAAAPQRVAVGAYVSDVQNLDLKTHSYGVDLYVWFKWKSPRLDPAESIEFMNPYELWAHARSKAYARPVRLPGGELYQVLRVQGRFSRKMLLDAYPFDQQAVVVEFEDSSRETHELEFVPDRSPVSLNPHVRLPGYELGSPRLAVERAGYPTEFGDPRRPPGTTYSRVRLEIPVTRPAFTYAVKLLLPILCVVVCAVLMFLFHPRHVDARVGIGITALLTIVALQITLNDDLPDVNYLILMDKIYLGAYLFVIAGLGLVVKTTRALDRGGLERAVRFEQRGLAALSAGFLLLLGGLAWMI